MLSYNDLAKSEKATVLINGGRMTDSAHANGWYVSPFVYRQEHVPGKRTVREEVFGPHVALVPFKDDADAVRIYNDVEFGLSMAVITEDFRKMRYYREECEFRDGLCQSPLHWG